MNLSKRFSVCGAALVVAVVATPLQAAPPFNVLKFDFNNVRATLTTPLGIPTTLAVGGASVTTFTGTITFSMATGTVTDFAGPASGNNTGSPSPANTFFAAGNPGTLGSIGGSLDFVLGVVTGVSLSFGNLVPDLFFTSVVSGSGVLAYNGTTSTYDVSGLTSGGFFTDPAPFGFFGPGGTGVDISRFWAPIANGIFFNFFIPEGVTTTESVQAELIIAIPLPQSVAMASVGLFCLGIRRRRL